MLVDWPHFGAVLFDLDGTLLDHDSYAFDAALPALRALQAREIPLILATSKTLAETARINGMLDNHQAVIVENGSALCFPTVVEYPFAVDADEILEDHAVVRLAPPYRVVRGFIDRQRAQHGWRLRGFGDMDTDEVADMTGLDKAAAADARQRLCGEPFIWLDSAEALGRFTSAARSEGLNVTQGGRFHHLMGGTDKARAMLALRAILASDRPSLTPVIALGDSENDRSMLEAADIAVVIRRHDGTRLTCRGIKRTVFTEQPGPAGWNTAVLQILGELPSQPLPT